MTEHVIRSCQPSRRVPANCFPEQMAKETVDELKKDGLLALVIEVERSLGDACVGDDI